MSSAWNQAQVSRRCTRATELHCRVVAVCVCCHTPGNSLPSGRARPKAQCLPPRQKLQQRTARSLWAGARSLEARSCGGDAETCATGKPREQRFRCKPSLSTLPSFSAAARRMMMETCSLRSWDMRAPCTTIASTRLSHSRFNVRVQTLTNG